VTAAFIESGQQLCGGADVEKPFVAPLANHDVAWLTVGMASTLAGNFTVLWSIANLIVVRQARSARVSDQLLGLLSGRRAADPDHVVIGTLWLCCDARPIRRQSTQSHDSGR